MVREWKLHWDANTRQLRQVRVLRLAPFSSWWIIPSASFLEEFLVRLRNMLLVSGDVTRHVRNAVWTWMVNGSRYFTNRRNGTNAALENVPREIETRWDSPQGGCGSRQKCIRHWGGHTDWHYRFLRHVQENRTTQILRGTLWYAGCEDHSLAEIFQSQVTKPFLIRISSASLNRWL